MRFQIPSGISKKISTHLLVRFVTGISTLMLVIVQLTPGTNIEDGVSMTLCDWGLTVLPGDVGDGSLV